VRIPTRYSIAALVFTPRCVAAGAATPPPAYGVYDCACAVSYRLFGMGNTPFAVRYRHLFQNTTWLVDRFHAKGHAETDVWCRTRCNPYAHTLTGLVTHLAPPRNVADAGTDAALASLEGKRSTYTVRSCVLRDTRAQGLTLARRAARG
jgi:hypothetical protein